MRTNRNILALGSLLVIAALVVSGCAAAQAAPAPAQAAAPQQGGGADAGPRLLSVNGVGTATATPDIAYVELGVDVKSASASEVVAESTDRMNKVMEALAELEVEEKDIRTVAYNMWVEEEHDREGNPTGERTYHVVHRVRVTVRALDQVGTLLEKALEAGANTVGGIQFAVEDPTALQQEAREKAIANAKDKAQQLADGLGVSLGEPYTINEYSAAGPLVERAMVMEARAVGGGAGPVPVSPGEL
ncbi:MAG: SIMPL domain-containing protein, partial [Anaerolineae bacterium]|nr:SIMPL domain-containing protein [Anaerolineae bacterium]